MIAVSSQPELEIARETFRESYNREPFGYTHNLSDLDLFEPDSLRSLAAKYADHPRDHYVAAGAPSANTVFYSVPYAGMLPAEALDQLDTRGCRVLMKRPEKFDPRFRKLLDTLFRQVVDLRGGLGGEKVLRLESAVLVSSAATTTPFHFDPEVNFFAQIVGEKIYHVFSPSALTEAELESFYVRGVVNIGQVGLQGRDPKHEHVFTLTPGKGMHQPQNAPHWVETGESRSVSYAFVFETNATRARGRVRAFNHYQRKLWLNPTLPGTRPALDGLKAGAMRALIPARKVVVKVLEKAQEQLGKLRGIK
jgi:hypothetical protein